MEEEDRDFILAQIREHKRNAILGVCFGIVLTGIVAIFPAYMWYSELTSIPRIFSVAWWAENDIRAIILGFVLLFIITALPVLPIIWVHRYIRANIIDYRRLKKIINEF